MIKIASWNVNSLKVRLEQVLAWLQEIQVDVLALQETKLTDEMFPLEAFKNAGYHVTFSGQKTYNGVAIISREPMSEVITDIPSLDDPQRRILGVTLQGIRLVNLYVPNGSEVGSDKYAYKLDWLQKMVAYLKEALLQHPRLVVVGDFNIAPQDEDVHDPAHWSGAVLVSPKERDAFQALLDLGLVDCFRYKHPTEVAYTWWDYRMAAFRRNMGLRIDHILMSEALLPNCVDCQIDRTPRRAERPSDHAPILVSLAI